MQEQSYINRSTLSDYKVGSEKKFRIIDPDQVSIIIHITDMHREYFINALEYLPILRITQIVVITHRFEVVKERL